MKLRIRIYVAGGVVQSVMTDSEAEVTLIDSDDLEAGGEIPPTGGWPVEIVTPSAFDTILSQDRAEGNLQ